jgi:hypothetical protein
LRAAMQLSPVDIEHIIRKQKLHGGAPDLRRCRSHEIDREIAGVKFKIVSNCGASRRLSGAIPAKHGHLRAGRSPKQKQYSTSENIAGVSRETLGRLDVLSKIVVRIAANGPGRQRPQPIPTFEEDDDHGDYCQLFTRRPYPVGVWRQPRQ